MSGWWLLVGGVACWLWGMALVWAASRCGEWFLPLGVLLYVAGVVAVVAALGLLAPGSVEW